MARRTGTKRTTKSKPTVEQARSEPPRDVKPLPSWYSPPVDGIEGADLTTMHGGVSYASQMIEAIMSGSIALPPWQRDDVWTIEQRVAMLDSMVRGIPLGPVVIWTRDGLAHAPAGTKTTREEQALLNRASTRDDATLEPLPFCGNTPHSRSGLLLDGRQRLTTLMMAYRGEMPVYWDGQRWGATGYISAQTAVTRPNGIDAFNLYYDVYDSIRVHDCPRAAYSFTHTHDIMCRYPFSYLEIRCGSVFDMAETYRRLVTRGTPHSAADLEALERWSSATLESQP